MDIIDRITLFTVLAVVLIDLFVDLFGVRARKARVTLDELCDEGIALGEQRGKGMSGFDKHRIAVYWVAEQAKRLRVKTNDAEVSKRIELRLSKLKKEGAA
jgi:hypothetical protein